MKSNREGFVVLLVLTILLILAASVILLLQSNKYKYDVWKDITVKENLSTNLPNKLKTEEKDTSGNGEVNLENGSFKQPSIDISKVRDKLSDILTNDFPNEKHSDIYYVWSNDGDDTVFIDVYKNTIGQTIYQDSYEQRQWSYNIDRDIEIFKALKAGENLVKDDSKSVETIYYFTEYRKIGKRYFSVEYYEFPPAGTVGRLYKFYDQKNNNLISLRMAFDDVNLRLYMSKNAQYFKEYKTYKYGDFPQIYANFFKKFENEVLEIL